MKEELREKLIKLRRVEKIGALTGLWGVGMVLLGIILAIWNEMDFGLRLGLTGVVLIIVSALVQRTAKNVFQMIRNEEMEKRMEKEEMKKYFK